MKKKKNKFKDFLIILGKFIKNFIMTIITLILIVLVYPFARCKIKGKNNVKKDDEARVFIFNHYQMFGPLAVVLNFPFRGRPWIIDKMIDEDKVEAQMGLLIYSQYEKVPRWLKKVALKLVKNLMVFFMKFFRGISVSRENPRKNIETMRISSETLNKNKSIYIFPEKDYVNEGIGYFMSGFEHIGKYHYQKTNKKISFYPVFISYRNKSINIGSPITFDPNKDSNIQKENTVKMLRNEMVNLYFEEEVVPEFKKNMGKK